MLGSALVPMTSDYIGRRTVFNATLMVTAVAGLIGAGAPKFVAVATFAAFISLGTGGNAGVDLSIFLETIPATHQYLLMIQASGFSVGALVAARIAWYEHLWKCSPRCC